MHCYIRRKRRKAMQVALHPMNNAPHRVLMMRGVVVLGKSIWLLCFRNSRLFR